MDVVVSKWIAIEGTAILAGQKREALLRRYPAYLVREAEDFRKYLSVEREAAIAGRMEQCTLYHAGKGGIFGALWEISCHLGVGLNIDLKKIPVRQETIEVCEFFDLNPYQMLSGGMLIMVTEAGEELTEELSAAGIPAQIIGTTNGGNDKLIRNGEKTRYLGPVCQDEIERFLSEEKQKEEGL